MPLPSMRLTLPIEVRAQVAAASTEPLTRAMTLFSWLPEKVVDPKNVVGSMPASRMK